MPISSEAMTNQESSRVKRYSSLTVLPTSPLCINQVVHAATHDLRTPLFVIKGYATFLQKTNVSPERDSRYSMIVEATNKMEGLINALIRLTDIQTIIPQDFETLSLFGMIEKVKLDLCNEIDQVNPKFSIDVKAASSFFISRKYLYEILKNLIQNAIIHNSDIKQLHIKIKARIIHGCLELNVKDNGFGMDLSSGQESLFAPFYRHVPGVKQPGVGLTIVKTILDHIGGHIKITSSPGKGTECNVFINEITVW